MTEYDIVFIQPSVLRKDRGEDPVVLDYFSTMARVGNLVGDSPLEPNYGMLTLAAILRNQGYSVGYLDLTDTDIQLRRQGTALQQSHVEAALQQFRAKIFGVSYMTVTFGMWGAQLARTLRKLYPTAHQLVGGIHASMCGQEVLDACPEIDYVIEGEAEQMIANLVAALIQGLAVGTLPGLRSRHREGTSDVSYSRLSDTAMRAVPYPAYDLALSAGMTRLVPRIYSARGCPQRCNFCVVSDFFSRNRSIETRYLRNARLDRFEAHLRQMMGRFNPSFFCLGDLTFAYDRDHAIQVCEVIERVRAELGSSCLWWAQTRADCLDPGLIDHMYNAGCRQIAVGVEGGQEEQRRRVIKRLPTRAVVDCLTMLRDKGFEIQTYWIIGLPGDSADSVAATMDVMQLFLESELTHLTHISVLVPYPGTAIHRHPEKFGIRLEQPRSLDFANYWMNCDPYGCGVPVYSTIDKSGSLLLSPGQIHELWLLSMHRAAVFYRNKHTSKKISNIQALHSPLLTLE